VGGKLDFRFFLSAGGRFSTIYGKFGLFRLDLDR